METVDPAQIDLEEAIAAATPPPMTVRRFAEETGNPIWRVRSAIAEGYIEVDRSKRPMIVEEGAEMPLTNNEWHRALAPAVNSLKPSVFSYRDGGSELHVLTRENEVRIFKRAITSRDASRQAREINSLNVARNI